MKVRINLFLLKVKNLIRQSAWSKISFIALGISSTIWFLIRVIPKPQRATYPCMRAAAPIMSTFVIYLLTLSGSLFALKKAKTHFIKARYIYATSFFVLAVACVFLFSANSTETAKADTPDLNSLLSNSPIGVEHGIFPGRVTWVFDPKVATWDGTNKYWWDDKSTLQTESDRMVGVLLKSLSGKGTQAEVWD